MEQIQLSSTFNSNQKKLLFYIKSQLFLNNFIEIVGNPTRFFKKYTYNIKKQSCFSKNNWIKFKKLKTKKYLNKNIYQITSINNRQIKYNVYLICNYYYNTCENLSYLFYYIKFDNLKTLEDYYVLQILLKLIQKSKIKIDNNINNCKINYNIYFSCIFNHNINDFLYFLTHNISLVLNKIGFKEKKYRISINKEITDGKKISLKIENKKTTLILFYIFDEIIVNNENIKINIYKLCNGKKALNYNIIVNLFNIAQNITYILIENQISIPVNSIYSELLNKMYFHFYIKIKEMLKKKEC